MRAEFATFLFSCHKEIVELEGPSHSNIVHTYVTFILDYKSVSRLMIVLTNHYSYMSYIL